MARTSSTSGDKPEDTTTEPAAAPDGPAPSTGDQPPAVVTTAEGDTKPLGAPVVDTAVPDGMTALVLDEPEPDPSAAAAGVTKERPYLLRVRHPHDRLIVPGGRDVAKGAEPEDLVVTKTFSPVSRAEMQRAQASTRGTGVKLVAAVPTKEA